MPGFQFTNFATGYGTNVDTSSGYLRVLKSRNESWPVDDFNTIASDVVIKDCANKDYFSTNYSYQSGNTWYLGTGGTPAWIIVPFDGENVLSSANTKAPVGSSYVSPIQGDTNHQFVYIKSPGKVAWLQRKITVDAPGWVKFLVNTSFPFTNNMSRFYVLVDGVLYSEERVSGGKHYITIPLAAGEHLIECIHERLNDTAPYYQPEDIKIYSMQWGPIIKYLYMSSASWVSPICTSTNTSKLRATWVGSAPSGSTFTVSYRISSDNITWGSWNQMQQATELSASGNYVQFKIDMTSNGLVTPTIVALYVVAETNIQFTEVKTRVTKENLAEVMTAVDILAPSYGINRAPRRIIGGEQAAVIQDVDYSEAAAAIASMLVYDSGEVWTPQQVAGKTVTKETVEELHSKINTIKDLAPRDIEIVSAPSMAYIPLGPIQTFSANQASDGRTFVITWSTPDSSTEPPTLSYTWQGSQSRDVSHYEIWESYDNGSTWFLFQVHDGKTSSCAVSKPATEASYKIRILAVDKNNNIKTYTSDNLVTGLYGKLDYYVIEYNINSGAWSTSGVGPYGNGRIDAGTNSYNYTTGSDANYKFRMKAVDKVGNSTAYTPESANLYTCSCYGYCDFSIY